MQPTTSAFSFISGGLEKMMKTWVPAVSAVGAVTTSATNIASAAGDAKAAEEANYANLAVSGAAKVAELLTNFRFAVTLMKGRGSGKADGTNFWSFDIDLVSLQDIPGMHALMTSYLAKGNHFLWTKVIAFSGGHFYMFGQDLGEMGGIQSSNSQDQAVGSALGATVKMISVLQKYFGTSKTHPKVDPCMLPESKRLAQVARLKKIQKLSARKSGTSRTAA